MKYQKLEIDLTEKIKAHLSEEQGNEEDVTNEAWAAEEAKGKTLNKPFRTSGGPKKFSVYVKNEKGNIVKVNFGDPNMEIKRDNPARRKSFRARHNCESPGPKTKAKYWSCKMWSKKSVTKVTKGSVEDDLLKDLDESEAAGDYMEKAFMKHCASYDKDLVNTAGMDQSKTYASCAMQYKKMKGTLYEKGEAGLTEKQKTLPKPIQDAILKKQGGKSEAALSEKQKKLPPEIQKQILKKKGQKPSDKKEDKKEGEKEEKSKAEEAEAKRGLWENIHKKRQRIKDGSGEKMRKKGDKGAPSEKQIKQAQKKKDESKAEHGQKEGEKFKPHKMYDKNGKAYDAKTYQDHLSMKKMGYTHEDPKMKSKSGYEEKKK